MSSADKTLCMAAVGSAASRLPLNMSPCSSTASSMKWSFTTDAADHLSSDSGICVQEAFYYVLGVACNSATQRQRFEFIADLRTNEPSMGPSAWPSSNPSKQPTPAPTTSVPTEAPTQAKRPGTVQPPRGNPAVFNSPGHPVNPASSIQSPGQPVNQPSTPFDLLNIVLSTVQPANQPTNQPGSPGGLRDFVNSPGSPVNQLKASTHGDPHCKQRLLSLPV